MAVWALGLGPGPAGSQQRQGGVAGPRSGSGLAEVGRATRSRQRQAGTMAKGRASQGPADTGS